MLISLALSFIATASGTLLTYTYDEDAPLAARLCSGACVGFAALGLIGFILASFIGLQGITLALTGIVLALPLLLLMRPRHRAAANADVNRSVQAISRATTRPDRWTFIYFLFYAAVAVVMWLVFARAMMEKPDGISTGVLNNFGDLPFHISAITRFAYGQNFPPEDPTFAGVPFTYPFITDFVSAMFLRAGASLRDSMFIENYIVGVALVGVLHRFGQQLLRNRTAAILTPLLIIFNGGFGWAFLFREANNAEGGFLQVLKKIEHSYTILPDVSQGWRWGNAVTSLLVTQRGFLLGIPLAAIVFGQWWLAQGSEASKSKKVKGKKAEPKPGPEQGMRDGKAPESAGKPSSLFPFSFFLLPSTRRMIAAGAVAGLLPLVHAHSFVVVMAMAAGLAVSAHYRTMIASGVALLAALGVGWGLSHDYLSLTLAIVILVPVAIGLLVTVLCLLPAKPRSLWVTFFTVAIVIAGPQLFWSTYHSAVSTTSFIGIEYGWGHGNENIVWFWLKNTGLFIPLLIAALIWKRDEYLVSRRLLFFYLPFTLCFIVPNLVRMAPWIWDNVKVLFYWWLASAPIVALLLARLWEGNASNRLLAVTLFVVLTLAGALDVFALITGKSDYGEFDRDGVAFAEQIKQQTPPQAMILHAPIHNTPIFLTGRRSLMGYPGHIWTHGLSFGEREADIKRIYAGAPDAPALLAKYSVDYVAIGPTEHAALKTGVNEAFFERYRKVIESGGYRLYKVSP